MTFMYGPLHIIFLILYLFMFIYGNGTLKNRKYSYNSIIQIYIELIFIVFE